MRRDLETQNRYGDEKIKNWLAGRPGSVLELKPEVDRGRMLRNLGAVLKKLLKSSSK